MNPQITQILWFIAIGFTGGFVYVLMHANDWEGLTKFGAFKRFTLGGIIGGLYWILYSEQDFPNKIMTFVSGYMGTDFIERLVARFEL